MRFLVEVALKQPPTPEIFELLPAETAHGKQFDATGVREALYISSQDVRAWQIYRAATHDEVERIVKSFPLTKFCKVTITALRE